MAPRRPDTGTRAARRPVLLLLAAAASLAVLLASSPAGADIYRWEDGEGAVHFTDDISTIPPARRGKATLHIREAPGMREPLPPAEATPGLVPGMPAPPSSPGEDGAGGPDAAREELLSRIEQVEAKILAKEQHIEAVDQKRSLAINPLRNRFVDPADLSLYEKYQAELPADRRELERLEEELAGLR